MTLKQQAENWKRLADQAKSGMIRDQRLKEYERLKALLVDSSAEHLPPYNR